MTPARRQTMAEKLTGRERQVLQGLCTGGTNPEIGEQIGISEATVKSYLIGLQDKFQERNRTRLALLAVYLKVVSIDECFA